MESNQLAIPSSPLQVGPGCKSMQRVNLDRLIYVDVCIDCLCKHGSSFPLPGERRQQQQWRRARHRLHALTRLSLSQAPLKCLLSLFMFPQLSYIITQYALVRGPHGNEGRKYDEHMKRAWNTTPTPCPWCRMQCAANMAMPQKVTAAASVTFAMLDMGPNM